MERVDLALSEKFDRRQIGRCRKGGKLKVAKVPRWREACVDAWGEQKKGGKIERTTLCLLGGEVM